jgi:hypothetical protein
LRPKRPVEPTDIGWHAVLIAGEFTSGRVIELRTRTGHELEDGE